MNPFSATSKRTSKRKWVSFPLLSMLLLAVVAGTAALAEAQTTTATTTEPVATTTPAATSTAPITPPATTSETAMSDTNMVPSTAQSLNEADQRRVINLAANISNQLEATVARFETIANRLEARAQRIDTAGGDTRVARQYLAQLRADLTTTRTDLAQIDQRVGAMATAANPAAAWQPLKQTYQQVNRDLRAARTSAIASVAALKVSAAVTQ